MEIVSKYCAGVEHAYVQATLVYCPHELRWSLLTTSWDEPGGEDLRQWASDRIDFGPFDDLQDVLEAARAHLVKCCRQLTE